MAGGARSVLVTGGSGYIGSLLAEQLAAAPDGVETIVHGLGHDGYPEVGTHIALVVDPGHPDVGGQRCPGSLAKFSIKGHDRGHVL